LTYFLHGCSEDNPKTPDLLNIKSPFYTISALHFGFLGYAMNSNEELVSWISMKIFEGWISLIDNLTS